MAKERRIKTDLRVILQTLAEKGGIFPHEKRIRFHCLRKFTIDHLSAFASESQWKQIVGKKIDEGAYISQSQLRGIYLRAMPSMLINGNGIKAKKLMELENAIGQLKKENSGYKTRLDLLEKSSSEQTSRIAYLEQLLKENNVQFMDALAKLTQQVLEIRKKTERQSRESRPNQQQQP